MAEDGSAGVRSVNLALDILEAVGFADEELGVTQIATRLHVAKGSVHRHLYTLVERGYLAQNPATSRYTIGPKSRLLARLARVGRGVIDRDRQVSALGVRHVTTGRPSQLRRGRLGASGTHGHDNECSEHQGAGCEAGAKHDGFHLRGDGFATARLMGRRFGKPL